MQTLTQSNKFRNLTFCINDTGVLTNDNSFLRFHSKEKFISFQDLGIDIEKESNYEGIPVLGFLTLLVIATIYIIIKNLHDKIALSIVFALMLLFILANIVFVIQKYLTTTYVLTGGKQTITFLRYDKSKRETLEFIEELKVRIKSNLIEQHNYLVSNFKPNDKFDFKQIDTNKNLTDKEFKLLQLKNELLYRNLILQEDDSDKFDWEEG